MVLVMLNFQLELVCVVFGDMCATEVNRFAVEGSPGTVRI
jgi:hypothetical protein